MAKSYKVLILLAFFSYEVPSGLTKQCVYEARGSEWTLTIRAYQQCPLTMEIPDDEDD